MNNVPSTSQQGPIPTDQSALVPHTSAEHTELLRSAIRPVADRRRLARIVRLGVILLLGVLLYFAFRYAPLREIWSVLRGLQIWQVASILMLDAFIYALISARWWFVVHADSRAVRYLPLIGVRISVFAISYFTLGPQIGGEPLQVLYLRRKQGLSYTRATASVVMDKLLELLGNFVVFSFGLVAFFQSGVLDGAPRPAIWLISLLIAWPVVHILLLYHGIYPFSALLRWLFLPLARSKVVRFVRASEHLAGQFCQRHPKTLGAGVLVSLVAAASTVSEYALVASFLHVDLPFWQLVTAWTSGWLSFLMPLPGGLGAFEASQVFILGSFGVSAAAAIGLALVLRGRDLLIGGLGMLLAVDAVRNGPNPKQKRGTYA